MEHNSRSVLAREKTNIEGVELVHLRLNIYDQGSLFEFVHEYDMPKFGQIYVVNSPARGVIRAYHKHKDMWEAFCVVRGSYKFVLVDDREGSRTYKEMQSVVLSEHAPQMLVVPAGIYHGTLALEDNSTAIAAASEAYNHEKPDEVRIPHDSFGDVWIIKPR
ncbi:MAG: dTDP-4-dehydrorhamnose 3,5-epimerase family protein [Parcubacteria group bacterium]|nr:dTDP-4-dehydrorhamnose 3,5-epimerase family protein [Parcubacteria group bacterium]